MSDNPKKTETNKRHILLKYPDVRYFFTLKLATSEKYNLYFLVIKISFSLTFFAK